MLKSRPIPILLGTALLGAVLLLAFLSLLLPDRSIPKLAEVGIRWLAQLALAGWVFVLPGWALLAGLWKGWDDLDAVEKLALAAGASLAWIPVLLLWLNLAGLRLGYAGAWASGAAGALFLAWKNRSALLAWPGAWGSILQKLPGASTLALWVVVIAVLGIRLWVIRGIDYPLWGDSLQHTVITQRILEENGLFQSWEPYAPYTTLTVQYGFPAAAAFYAWVSGEGSPQAVLWTGQLLNAIAVLGLYPLAMRFSNRRRWAGVAALLVGGLLVPMPMMYVNWGRYAQLAGQAILPAAICFSWELLSSPRLDWKKAVITALTLAGMLLAYYRMFFYIFTFFAAWLVAWGLLEGRLEWKHGKPFLAAAGAIALLGALLVLPWLANVQSSNLAGSLEAGLTAAAPWDAIRADFQAWNYVTDYVPPLILGLSAAAVLWSLFRRKWSIAGIAFWAGLLALVKAGQLINLPGANMMQSYAVMIFLYAPASLLCGWLLGEVAAALEARSIRLAGPLLALAAAGVSMWGAYQLKNIVQPAVFAYVTRADVQAAGWIRQNTPAGAVFLVEGYRIYGGSSVVGSDAGWWLPLTAGRRNTLPPQYALFNEKPEPPDYSQRVVSLVAELENAAPPTPAGLTAICRMGVTHVYIGQGQGLVGSGARQLYSRESLLDSPLFTEIYHQDQVSVFALKSQACQQISYDQTH